MRKATPGKWRWLMLHFVAFFLLLFAGEAVVAQNQPMRSVAITFDDLPGAAQLGCQREQVLDTTRRLLAKVRARGVPAIGFVNEGRPCAHIVEEVLTLWLEAGMALGNHTATHPDLNDVSVAAYQADILRGEPMTRRLLEAYGGSLRFFRFPYLHAGDTPEKKDAVEAFLADRGYAIAPVTIDSDEWIFARAYARALALRDSADLQRIETTYIEWMESVVAHFENWSTEVVGYEVPQVLLLHANQLNAAAFAEVAAIFERRGYRFITLEEALEDPAYAQPDPYVGRHGNSWLHRWARGQGMDVRWEPDAPDWIVNYGE